MWTQWLPYEKETKKNDNPAAGIRHWNSEIISISPNNKITHLFLQNSKIIYGAVRGRRTHVRTAHKHAKFQTIKMNCI